MKQSSYMTRALRSADPRFAQVLGKLGHPAPAATLQTAAAPSGDDGDNELTALRAEYQDVVGKRAYHGWDAAELREKIAAARAEA